MINEDIIRDKKGRFVNGQIPWNKELTKETDDRLKKMGETSSITKKRLFAEGKLIPTWKKNVKIDRNKYPNMGHFVPHSEETKNILRMKNKDKVISDESRKKMSQNHAKYWLGKERSEESKENMRHPHKPLSEETKVKMSLAKKGKHPNNYGKHHSEETKNILRKIRKGKTYEEIFGEEKTKEILNKISESQKGKVISIEAINKIKKARAKQVLPTKDTKIEVKIQNFLKQLGIEFFTHQHMKIKNSYQCDILIPSMNIVIECDGNYWHKYPIGTDIDHIRTKELIEKGFKVLRLWEFEIKAMDLTDFQNKLNIKENR